MPPIIRTNPQPARPPWANYVLLLCLVAGFLVQQTLPDADAWALNSRDPQVAQFITYSFLHLNWVHLGGNLLALAIFGPNVNDRLGHIGHVAFFLAGAVVAGAAFVLFSKTGAVIGASGAAGALMGAYLALWPTSRIILRLIGPTLSIPAAPFILIYFLFNVAMALDPTAGIAYSAHLGGMAFGLTLVVLLQSVGLIERHPADLPALARLWRRRAPPPALVQTAGGPSNRRDPHA